MQQAPQPGRHCMGMDCALALRSVGRCLLCFTWNKLGFFVHLVLTCIGLCALSWQRGAGSEGASGRASMLAVPPSAGLLSVCSYGAGGCATRPLQGLKHARHPLAAGQGQTCPSLRASDANKAPGQRPPQPFDAPLLCMRRVLSFDGGGLAHQRPCSNRCLDQWVPAGPAAAATVSTSDSGVASLLYIPVPQPFLRSPPAGRNRDVVGVAGRAPCWRRAAKRRGGHVRSTCFVN